MSPLSSIEAVRARVAMLALSGGSDAVLSDSIGYPDIVALLAFEVHALERLLRQCNRYARGTDVAVQRQVQLSGGCRLTLGRRGLTVLPYSGQVPEPDSLVRLATYVYNAGTSRIHRLHRLLQIFDAARVWAERHAVLTELHGP